MTSFGKRLAIFALLFVACAALLLAYVRFVYHPRTSEQTEARAVPSTDDAARLAEYSRRPHVVFVNTTYDENNNRVALAALDAPGGSRLVTRLRCERVHMAAHVGMCLNADRGVLTKYYGYLFDESFHERARFPLQGTPSRTRVSPDGKLAAVTVFVNGDSYAANSFSTRTSIIDATSGQMLGELEQFTADRDGVPFRAADFNYWGVTFTREPGIFYATLATAGHKWLVRGNASTRRVSVVYDEVECPSLSPDDTRVVYKKRETTNGRMGWRLYVLTLQTLTAVPLAEVQSVDDQAEWLDATHVLYSLPDPVGGSTVWVTPADGSGTPSPFLRQAYSPAPVNP